MKISAPATFDEHARADRPGGAGGRTDRFGGGERVDDLRSDDRAGDQRDQPRSHAHQADVHECAAAPPPCEPQRSREQRQHEQRQDHGQAAQQAHRRLHGFKRFGAEDLDLRDARGNFFRRRGGRAEARGEFGDDRAQVEDHRAAAGGAEHPALVLDQVDELLVGDLVGGLPQLLHARLLERQDDPFFDHAAQPAGRRPGQRLQFAGQARADFAGDVDVLVDLVGQIGRQLFLDRGVLEQLGVGFGPVGGVEQLAVGPHRQDADDAQQRGERQQRAHQPDVRAVALAGGRGAMAGCAAPRAAMCRVAAGRRDGGGGQLGAHIGVTRRRLIAHRAVLTTAAPGASAPR